MHTQRLTGSTPPDEEKIVLDRSAFRALASDTRVDILKSLDERQKTLTELSHDLNLAVATVKEHIIHLVNSDLIFSKDEGRKWKYYELSDKGKAVLYPERKKIWVLLISILFTVSLGFYMQVYDIGYLGSFDDYNPTQRAMIRSASVAESIPVSSGDESEVAKHVMDTTGGNSADTKQEVMGIASIDRNVSEEEILDNDLNSSSNSDLVIDIQTQDVKEQIPWLRYGSFAISVFLIIVGIVYVLGMQKRKNAYRRSEKKH